MKRILALALLLVATNISVIGCITPPAPQGTSVTQRELRVAMKSGSTMQALDKRKVVLSGPLFIISPQFAIEYLRPGAKAVAIEGARLTYEGDCVDLVIPHFQHNRSQGPYRGRVVGELRVVGPLASESTGIVASMKVDGVTFRPKCNYLSDVYAFVLVEEIGIDTH